ncbi:MAG: response regulator transcription factor [Clostridia bacterium]|nr:response regulator transcription factor [Clostridia bacterium]
MRERTLRVLIADGRARVRSALRLLLIQEPGVSVVGEAEDAARALSLALERRPDLVLLDWELPPLGGPAVLARLRTARPGLAVIALSGWPEARRAALASGVDAFVSKGDPPERLLAAVRGFCP